MTKPISLFQKFKRRTRQGLTFVVLGTLLGLSGCLEVEREEPDSGDNSNDRNAGIGANLPPASGLNLIMQDQSTTLPARVSVAFKLETDTGVPVPNLPAENFDLFENGTLISVAEAAKRVTPEDGDFIFSTLLLLDLSGSVVLGSLDGIKEAAVSFIREVLPPAAEGRTSKVLAVAIFDGRAEIEVLTEYLSNPDHLIEQVYLITEERMQDPSTNLYGAAIEGLQNVTAQVNQTRVDHPEVFAAGAMVLFTDGTDQAARVEEAAALEVVAARPEDVAVMTIGLGSEINANVLESLGPDGFRVASELNDLVTSFGDIAQFVSDEADSFYKLDYCSPKRAGDENVLTVVANLEGLSGALDVTFSAEGFGGRCQL